MIKQLFDSNSEGLPAELAPGYTAVPAEPLVQTLSSNFLIHTSFSSKEIASSFREKNE